MANSTLREAVADLIRESRQPERIADEVIALIRAEALEEAAKEVERVFGKHVVSAAIRALKEKE